MYKVFILPPAKQDISEAAACYNSKQKGLGRRFTQEVSTKVSIIKQNPKTSAVRFKYVRTSLLDVFAFMIHYTIDENKKMVIILAVFHTSLSTDRWSKR